MRIPAICVCENKGTDQLHGSREAVQCLCFRYTDSTISLLPKFQAPSNLLWLYSPVCVRPGRKPRRPVFSQRGSNMSVVITLKECNFSFIIHHERKFNNYKQGSSSSFLLIMTDSKLPK